MIPLSDNIRSHRRPWITYMLIIANTAIFLYQLSLGRAELARLVTTYGVIPAFIGDPFIILFPHRWPALVPLVTAAFLHGGWLHFGGNMLYMWIFADNVESSMGSGRFLLFYLITGALGNFAHAVMNPQSMVPTIGASGAIAGVLGAYLLMFPHARVLALVPLGLFLTVVEIPAVVFLLVWFLIQVLSGTTVLGAQAVAWWAHIGGFLAGAILVFWFRADASSRGRRTTRRFDFEDHRDRPWR